MEVQNILSCSFPNWYPNFSKLSAKSIIIPLPEDFVKYLLCDGLVLPKSCDNKVSTNYDSDEDEDEIVKWDSDNDEFDEAVAPNFPEFEDQIKKALIELNGKAFPKLNWSSPKDAAWITMSKNLKCQSFSDLILLLKSSDFICHDLTAPFKGCSIEGDAPTVNYALVLRKWIEIKPDTEFRCFVYNNKLVAICQRDYSNFYEHLIGQDKNIITDIVSFFKEHLMNKFPESQYVFDVYRKRKDFVKLIDFNPFGEVTDSLLFEWSEFKEGSDILKLDIPEFRHNKERGVAPDPFRYYGVPRDVSDCAGMDMEQIITMMRDARHTE